MRRVRFGDTPLVVSRLAMGTGTAGHIDENLTPEQLAPVLKRAYELGVTFWDTGDFYKTHPHVRLGLQAVNRQEIVLVSKTHAKTAEEAEVSLARYFTELGTDYLDLINLHGVSSLEDFESRRGALKYLKEARARGLVRAVGLSTHHLEVARALPELVGEGIEAALLVLNKTGHNLASGTPAEMAEAARKASERGVGIYAMKVLGHKKALADHSVEELLAHTLAMPFVHALAVGMNHIPELEQDVEIVERLDG